MRLPGVMRKIRSWIQRSYWLADFTGSCFAASGILFGVKLSPDHVWQGAYRGMRFLFRGRDLSALREVLTMQEYDFLTPLIAGGAPVILDIGAHIGLFALWALQQNPASRLLSVEASPGTFALLAQNAALGAQAGADWRILQRAACDGERIVSLSDGTTETMSHHLSEGGKIQVTGIGLARIARRGGRPDRFDESRYRGRGGAFYCGQSVGTWQSGRGGDRAASKSLRHGAGRGSAARRVSAGRGDRRTDIVEAAAFLPACCPWPDPPLITIGVTAHNAAATIKQALHSALAQDYPSVEIIVYDDASQDGTAALAESFGERVRMMRGTENHGVAFARNRIIEAAQGELIAFFDDDDESAAERLSWQYARLTTYEATFAGSAPVICHTARRQVYPDGRERVMPTMGTAADCMAPHGQAVINRILFNEGTADSAGALATCSQLARLATYRTLGGFDETFRRAEDTDFALRLAAADGHFAGIAAPLVRQTMTLADDKRLADDAACALQLFDKHRTLFGARAAYQRRWLQLKYDYLMRRHAAFLSGLGGLALRHPVQTLRPGTTRFAEFRT